MENAVPPSDHSAILAIAENPSPGPCEVLAPARQTVPLVFSSPHSGRLYPPEFIAQARLDAQALRGSEDAFVDEVFAAALDLGAPLLRAHFPRAYVDANREPFELDPAMFEAPLPDYVTTTSRRIADGLGTIPRVVAGGEEIYATRLRFDDALRRIETHYLPYHRVLAELLDATRQRFGFCLLVDCHSMPSTGGRLGGVPGHRRVDVVLGDCRGTACAPVFTAVAEAILRDMGFAVVRNAPYAGGYTTQKYGRPKQNAHALQIEINRALYMDEKTITRGPRLPALAKSMKTLIETLAGIDPGSPENP